MNKLEKVQCVSTECGNCEHLRLGCWYEPKDRTWNDDDIKDKIVLEHHYQDKDGVFKISQKVYDRKLFRTLTEIRDSKLSKVLNN